MKHINEVEDCYISANILSSVKTLKDNLTVITVKEINNGQSLGSRNFTSAMQPYFIWKSIDDFQDLSESRQTIP